VISAFARRCALFTTVGFMAMPAAVTGQENRVAAELRREGEQFRETCGSLQSAMGCGTLIATGKPIHLSFGSIAPGNGVALGASFGTRHNPNENWRLTWSADAVRTFGGSYRAGAYMRLIRVSAPPIIVVTDPAAGTPASELAPRPQPVVHFFAQAASLQNAAVFRPEDVNSRASFGMTNRIVGASATVPLRGGAPALNLSISGDLIGRFVSLRDATATDAPGIFAAYDDVQAPGLDVQPDHIELGAAVRIRPSAGRFVTLDYLLHGQRFAASEDGFSFGRWTLDLRHEVALYGRSPVIPARASNTPNDCELSAGSTSCPNVQFTRDRRGSIQFRVLAVTSTTSEGNRVPFYLQPTLGGRDINGAASLESFDDYRFRGPHLLLLQQTFEHSVYGPIGAWFRADQGMVADRRDGLDFGRLRKSVAFGISVRAGGLPMLIASYSVGGGEGRHTSVVIGTSLLGGASRPSFD
jgi:hypothetical protein